jgi:hypothetical protein
VVKTVDGVPKIFNFNVTLTLALSFMKSFSYILASAAALSICFAFNAQAAQPRFSGAFEDAPFFSPITVGQVLFFTPSHTTVAPRRVPAAVPVATRAVTAPLRSGFATQPATRRSDTLAKQAARRAPSVAEAAPQVTAASVIVSSPQRAAVQRKKWSSPLFRSVS